MKIYFTTTTNEFEKYEECYLAIRKSILAHNNLLTRDWIPNIVNNPRDVEDQRNGSHDIYRKTIAAIEKADMMIVENTVSSFSNGHLITLALQAYKPVLILELKEKQKPFFEHGFTEAINSDLIKVETYTLESIEKIVENATKWATELDDEYRFNLKLTKAEKKYLDWASFHQGLSRTKLIRKGIGELEKKDIEYQAFLRSH